MTDGTLEASAQPDIRPRGSLSQPYPHIIALHRLALETGNI
jgi:hypothetical protein